MTTHRRQVGLGRLLPENLPDPRTPYEPSVGLARKARRAPIRRSPSGQRWCAFCNRTIAPNARVCEVHRRTWSDLLNEARQQLANERRRRDVLADAFRTLAQAANAAADRLLVGELDPVTERSLTKAENRLKKVRDELMKPSPPKK